VEFGEWFLDDLAVTVPHRHIVFSLPKLIRTAGMVCAGSGENVAFCGSSGVGYGDRLKSYWRKVKDSSVGSR